MKKVAVQATPDVVAAVQALSKVVTVVWMLPNVVSAVINLPEMIWERDEAFYFFLAAIEGIYNSSLFQILQEEEKIGSKREGGLLHGSFGEYHAILQVEVEQFAVASFGGKVNISLLHDFQQPFSGEAGVMKDSPIADYPVVDPLKYLTNMLDAVVKAGLPSGKNPVHQLILIIANCRFHEKFSVFLAALLPQQKHGWKFCQIHA
ncbi:hypothetical protein M5K25_004508 [Dendrobium thyrsiflorum]|uniref:Exocyst subunit Exo70 family protein n=1 Tax=Dendrobium thyrsiflorum TaxID=117978 RepID=A0ABD0VMU4_DENTH